MKIALVKQDVYTDLYVGGPAEGSSELLFQSLGRVGPFGLLYYEHADFYIIKEGVDSATKSWRYVNPRHNKICRRLKTEHLADIDGQRFKKTKSRRLHSQYAVDVFSVDWGQYDLVVSINCAIPVSIIKEFPGVFWAYMIGEANVMQDKVYYGYDASLNQEIMGRYFNANRIIDFPYTLLRGDTLSEIMAGELQRESASDGVYMEINMFKERPVVDAGSLGSLIEGIGLVSRMHKQCIYENLIELFDSKYFVKIRGRRIRGNSVIEAISSGCLVLLDPSLCITTQLIPQECWVRNENELLEKLRFYEDNPNAYREALIRQQRLLDHIGYDVPMGALMELVKRKKKASRVVRYNVLRFFYDMLKRWMSRRRRKQIIGV